MTTLALERPAAVGPGLERAARRLLARLRQRQMPARRRLNLALQGGGTHGAFTWGVLDRLLEEDDLEIVAISGASAGAMNAAVMAHGLAMGGREEARAALDRFWRRIARQARWRLPGPTLLERLTGVADARLLAGRLWLEGLARLASPYALNPSGHNPLSDILAQSVDFELLRRRSPVRLFVSATNVRTGKVRIFGPGEISHAAVLASACLPQLFHAVEIEGEHYWDGGYASNPPVRPLLEQTDCQDILIVQVDPLRIEGLPTTAQAIRDRAQVLAFNAGFMREMQGVAAQGRARLHLVEAESEMARLGGASRLDVDEAFLLQLFALGRGRAQGFLARHKAAIGVCSSLDAAERYL